jgi:hypothetical protein
MRRKVALSDILDHETYASRRDTLRAMVMEVKRRRRIHLGPCMTFLFENVMTTWYQIQETIRAERIAHETDIQHQIDTYNALMGGPGELACCLLIEIEDEEVRRHHLREWRGLPGHVILRCESNVVVRAAFDPAQANDEQLSSVQYLRFCVGHLRPVAVGCDFPGLAGETTFDDEQREALNRDLESWRPRRSNL